MSDFLSRLFAAIAGPTPQEKHAQNQKWVDEHVENLSKKFPLPKDPKNEYVFCDGRSVWRATAEEMARAKKPMGPINQFLSHIFPKTIERIEKNKEKARIVRNHNRIKLPPHVHFNGHSFRDIRPESVIKKEIMRELAKDKASKNSPK